MSYRVILSIVFILSLIFLSCDQNNPSNSGKINPVVLNDLAFSIKDVDNVHPGEKITVEINMHDYKDTTYDIGGFELYIAYDLDFLNFDSVSMGEMIRYCGWFYFTSRHYIDTIENKQVGSVRIVALSDHYFADPICYTPTDSSTEQIAQIHFSVIDNQSLRRQNTPIQFFWENCGNNLVVDRSANNYYLSKKIISNGRDISEITQYPNFTGYNLTCDSIMDSRNTNYYRIVDYVDGSVIIR